jgi:hypothetical protein
MSLPLHQARKCQKTPKILTNMTMYARICRKYGVMCTRRDRPSSGAIVTKEDQGKSLSSVTTVQPRRLYFVILISARGPRLFMAIYVPL